jgi:hypothetical protein
MGNLFDVWNTDIIYFSGGVWHRVSRVPSGKLHQWLRDKKYKIKYDYDACGWLITGISLSDAEIAELDKLKNR